MYIKTAIAAAVVLFGMLGAAIAEDAGGGGGSGSKTDHNDKSNMPLCDGSAGQVENQNCRMPN